MLSEEAIRARRAELARRLLQMRREGGPGGYEYDQAQHWIYCLTEVLGNDREPGEPLDRWLERIAPVAGRDRAVADAIRRGKCPFGELKPGQTFAHCPLGFPGCGCADEMTLNPLLADMRPGPPTE